MVLIEYAKRIMLFEAEGYHPLTIAKMLESEGTFITKRGVAKFLLRVKATGSITRQAGGGKSQHTHKNRSGVHSATCVNNV